MSALTYKFLCNNIKKLMKSIYILLSIIILNTLILQSSFADESIVQANNNLKEEFCNNTENTVDFSKMRFNENENPVTYKYFTDYADLLRKNINFNKFYFFGYRPFNDWYMSYHYKLHKDGTISDLKPTLENSPRGGKPINKYYENIIQTVLPPPFPDNIEIGDVDVILVVYRTAGTKTDLYFLNQSGIYQGNTVNIYITKKTWECVMQRVYEYFRYAQWQYRGVEYFY